MPRFRSSAMTLLCFASALMAAGPRSVIIDTDPGVDDAYAVLMALRSPEIKVEAITVVAGNVPVEDGLQNTLHLVELARRQDVPVFRGADSPLLRKLVTGAYGHKGNELGGVTFEPPKLRAQKEAAVTAICRIVHANPGKVSLLTLGPLTNIATALKVDSSLAPAINEIVIMGGSLSGGNITPSAEFNMYVDPEAARIVLQSGVSITMVGLDVARSVLLTDERIEKLEQSKTASSQFSARLSRNTIERYKKHGWTSTPIVTDPISVAVFADRKLMKTTPVYVDIETAGELSAGETVGYKHGPVRRSSPSASDTEVKDPARNDFLANVKVGTELDVNRFFEMMTERLASK